MVDFGFFYNKKKEFPCSIDYIKICFCLECDYAELFQVKMNHTNNLFYRSHSHERGSR